LTTQVTLPALRDSAHVAAVTLLVVVLGVTSLPVLLSAGRNPESAGAAGVIRYAVGSTAICLTLGITVTFLFLPKVVAAQSSLCPVLSQPVATYLLKIGGIVYLTTSVHSFATSAVQKYSPDVTKRCV